MKWFTMVAVFMLSAAAVIAEPADGQAPSAEEMLHQMLRPPGAAAEPIQPAHEEPAMDRSTGPGTLPPGAPSRTVLREGTRIVDRLGRLTRSPEGSQMEFTFESDGQALADPPMVILPNLNLMAMENRVQASRGDLRFRITGTVTEYRGRNHILLEKVILVPDAAGP